LLIKDSHGFCRDCLLLIEDELAVASLPF